MAQGSTIMTGIHHWTRGYEGLENKLSLLGARVTVYEPKPDISVTAPGVESREPIQVLR